MKIVLAMDSFYPSIEGPVVVLHNFATIMNKTEDVHVFVPSQGKETDKEEAKKRNLKYPVYYVKSQYEPFSKYYSVTPFYDRGLSKHFKELDVDIVHLHSPFFMAAQLIKKAKKRNIPTVLTFHTKFRDEFMRVTHSKIATSFLMSAIMSNFKNADYVFTVSEGAKQCLIDYGYKKEIKVIRNGTDLVCPTDILARREHIDEKYNLKGQENVFLFVGRMVITKNLELVFKALKIVKEKGVNFKFLVVGDGPDLHKFKDMAKENNVMDQTIFAGSIADRDYLRSFYLRSDLFLFPSVFDTASLVPIESATFSLPTLLVKDSPTSEIIIDNRNGYAEIEDSEAWANKIIAIIKNKDHHMKVREMCHKEVYRTWDDVVKEMLDEYKRILAEWNK
ncbi:MAG: glycosyltransferase [Erysipelotrichales bacterium]|nr:glycosyltransferase [Erysipelotrichales bacterium]